MKTTKYRVVYLSLGWMMIGGVCLLSLLPLSLPQNGLPSSDKLGHYLAYFSLTFWFLHLYKSQLLVVLGFMLMGLMIEFIQPLTGYRYFELADILANGAGVLSAWLLLSVFGIRLSFLK